MNLGKWENVITHAIRNAGKMPTLRGLLETSTPMSELNIPALLAMIASRSAACSKVPATIETAAKPCRLTVQATNQFDLVKTMCGGQMFHWFTTFLVQLEAKSTTNFPTGHVSHAVMNRVSQALSKAMKVFNKESRHFWKRVLFGPSPCLIQPPTKSNQTLSRLVVSSLPQRRVQAGANPLEMVGGNALSPWMAETAPRSPPPYPPRRSKMQHALFCCSVVLVRILGPWRQSQKFSKFHVTCLRFFQHELTDLKMQRYIFKCFDPM